METRVRDLLRRKGHDVVATAPTATVRECIATMVKHNVGSIVVMDGAEVAGIFTERDYLRRIALRGRTSRTTRVEEVMTPDVIRVEPDTLVEQCMQIMTAHKCRHLPVVDDGKLVGIVSIGDCVKQVSHDAQSEADTLKAYITGQYPA
ncbi:MAG: CBS domain-containing protein [Bacteroidetes bacterium]|jgi:CBS domain-containing protein|nr:CBS domain-containing protein [Bacteroidota bacterium]